jgi:hypothetical protein
MVRVYSCTRWTWSSARRTSRTWRGSSSVGSSSACLRTPPPAPTRTRAARHHP